MEVSDIISKCGFSGKYVLIRIYLVSFGHRLFFKNNREKLDDSSNFEKSELLLKIKQVGR